MMLAKRTRLIVLVASAVMLAVGIEPTRALPLGQSLDPPGEALPGNGGEGVAQGLAATSDGPLGYNFAIYNDSSLTEVYPAVAYNSDRQEYLVVWYNDRSGCDDIRAQRVSKNRTLVGGAFYISAGCDHNRHFPDVAYNSQHEQYLVVWENEHPSTGDSIRGRRVSGTGAVLDSNDIVIQVESGLYTPFSPAVAYASTADRYLVVWSETWHPTIAHYIVAQVVTPSGSLEGSEVTVSATDDKTREDPDLAYNRARNEFLVVWRQYYAAGDRDIYGRRVAMNPTMGVLGGLLAICTLGGDDETPAVAALPYPAGTGQYLVVWKDHPGTSADILALQVTGDGNISVAFIYVAHGGVDETNPAVAGNENGQRYFVTWSWQTDPPFIFKNISGRTVSLGGSVGKEIYVGGLFADHPAVAAGPLGDFLAVFDDTALTSSVGIYGQLWGNRVYLPLVLRNFH